MQALKQITRLVQDSPPEYVFEISGAGIAWTRRAAARQIAFQPLPAGALAVTPLKDNVLDAAALETAVRAIANGSGAPKRRRAAVILPDYSARVAVLDFDAFPSDHQEQEALVRFRMKRFVPFDIDAAAVSFRAQQRPGEKRYDVVVVVVGLEIVARYEAPFRAAGFHPGFVTTSTMAAASLAPSVDLTVIAKLDGRALSVAVLKTGSLRLVRCVELSEVSVLEVMSVLYPTFAFMEDELSHRPELMSLCGFGNLSEDLIRQCQAELAVAAEPLRSRFGAPGQGNAGLLGYLESIEG